MDAIAFLKEDHKKVKGLLSELEETTNRAAKTRERLLAEIEQELKAHTTIEEEIFYPAFRKAAEKTEEREMFFEAKEEHRLVDFELPRVKKLDPNSEDFHAHAKVLKELVEHHADEEEKEMFPAAKKLMEKDDLDMLGEQMEIRKAELLAKAS